MGEGHGAMQQTDRRPPDGTASDSRVSWWHTQIAELPARRPRSVRVLRDVWQRPLPILLVMAFVAPGSLGGVIPDGDASWFRQAAASMLGPDVLDVFAEPGLQIGPLYLLALGLLTAAVDAVGLPVLFVVSGLQSVGVTWLAVVTVRRLTRSSGADPTAAQWAVGLPLAVGGLLAESIGNGHPEEILLGLLFVHAALAARDGRRVLPGLLIGLATGTKLWGALGAPVLLVRARPRDLVTRGLWAGAIVAVSYGPFLLFGEVNTFDFVWGMGSSSTLSLLPPWMPASGWGVRLAQGLAVGTVGAVLALRRSVSPLTVVAAIIAVRLLLDPLRLSYYSGPLVVVLLLWLWTSPARPRARWAVALTSCAPVVVLAPYFMADLPDAVISTILLVAAPVILILRERSASQRGGPGHEQAVISYSEAEPPLSTNLTPAGGAAGR